MLATVLASLDPPHNLVPTHTLNRTQSKHPGQERVEKDTPLMVRIVIQVVSDERFLLIGHSGH